MKYFDELDDYLSLDFSFERSHQSSVGTALIKRYSEDFYVEELLDVELKDEGEHVWLWVEKQEQNTEYIAKQIARFAGVRAMDIGFSGLKDRWAVTRQWFSVYLGNKKEPIWSEHEIEGLRILKQGRNLKKLRRGEHSANRFVIKLREVSDIEGLLQLLETVKKDGFPNYYGKQRFGRDGANLIRAIKWYKKEIKASRSQRAFYLSATRSFLFNLNLESLIKSGKPVEIDSLGPLYGDPVEGVLPLNEQEQSILDQHPILAQIIHANRMKLDRRKYFVIPNNMCWTVSGDLVTINFDLPTGSFATSLLSDVVDLREVPDARFEQGD